MACCLHGLALLDGAKAAFFLFIAVAKDHAMWPTNDFACGSWKICHNHQCASVMFIAFETAHLSLQVQNALKLQDLKLVDEPEGSQQGTVEVAWKVITNGAAQAAPNHGTTFISPE